MCKVISLTVIIVSFMMIGYLMFRSIRGNGLTDRKQLHAVLQLAVNSIFAFTCFLTRESLCCGVAAGSWLVPFALVALVSPYVRSAAAVKLSNAVVAVQVVLIILNLIYISGKICLSLQKFYIVCHLIEGILCLIAFTMVRWHLVRDLKALFASGSVWNNLENVVDSIYVLFLMVFPLLSIALQVIFPDTGAFCLLVILMELGMMAALCMRISQELQFVLMQKHETLILESLKISQLEMSVSGQNDVYKELYERVAAYFEYERPYLNSKLTINDVAKVVYSNRLYISRAINQCTGRNFCQFVNYYRIAYAIESFRSNPDLKVGEISGMSGFNSPVTFNVAFHLFMNDNPSDWFRKERVKILNKKK